MSGNYGNNSDISIITYLQSSSLKKKFLYSADSINKQIIFIYFSVQHI